MAEIAILDVDGTLVDTNYQHAIAWFRAFRRHFITVPIWRIHRHIGMGGDQLVAAVAGDEVEKRAGDRIREAEHYIELLDAAQIVDAWTTSADVESTKPEPDLIKAALDKVDADGEALLIGDTVWDVEAAKRAGVETLAVLTGGFSEQELRDAGAREVYTSVEELRQGLSESALSR